MSLRQASFLPARIALEHRRARLAAAVPDGHREAARAGGLRDGLRGALRGHARRQEQCKDDVDRRAGHAAIIRAPGFHRASRGGVPPVPEYRCCGCRTRPGLPSRLSCRLLSPHRRALGDGCGSRWRSWPVDGGCAPAVVGNPDGNYIAPGALFPLTQKLTTQDSKLKTQNSKLKTQNSELRTQNSETALHLCHNRRRRRSPHVTST